MCKPLTNIPQNKSAHLGTRKPGKTYANSKATGKRSGHGRNQKKALCIIGGESEALGFHQETARSVLYKLYIIFWD